MVRPCRLGIMMQKMDLLWPYDLAGPDMQHVDIDLLVQSSDGIRVFNAIFRP